MFENKQVTSEVEAYLLGFIYADGCITSHKKIPDTLKIDLARSDELFLNILNQYLNGKMYKITKTLNKKIYQQIRLCVYDRKLCSRLITLGISLNKTYENSDQIFSNIPKNLKWDFIRGFFDGDGCIDINKKKQATFSLCSKNRTLLNSLLNYIKITVPGKSNITNGDGVLRIRIGGNKKIVQIYNLMYKNQLSLNRKRLRFEEIYNVN
jgi:intein/homing endonuclease